MTTEPIYYVVTPGPGCPFPIDCEGIYEDRDIALHVRDRCDGDAYEVQLNEHLTHLQAKKWVYNSCIKISVPEMVFCRPQPTMLNGGEDIMGHSQWSPDQDRFYAYMWARDESEVAEIMVAERARRINASTQTT